MSTDQLKLLLAPLEVEVVQEALELYVQMRPVPTDHRFEYRYRAARSVLESLRQGTRELGCCRPETTKWRPSSTMSDRHAVRSASEWKTERRKAITGKCAGPRPGTRIRGGWTAP